MNPTPTTPADFQVKLTTEALREIFGQMNDEILATVLPMLEWVEVAGGEVVVRQGGTDRDLYFVLTGRLRAYGGDGPQRRRPRTTPSEGPERRALSDITRGQTIGEASFISGAPRNATVVALRDSLLARISRPKLEELVAAYPQLALSMARLVLKRQKAANAPRQKRRRPTNLCLMPFTPGVDVLSLGERLLAGLSAEGEAILLTASALDARLGRPGIANVGKSQGVEYRELTIALDELESSHASILLVPDADLASEWSRRCLRIADRILLVTDAAASPESMLAKAEPAEGEAGANAADRVLVLLHDKDKRVPERTAAWLDRCARGGISGHVHVRPGLEADIARLARTQGASSTGLVLCGGGARCFAHLGVYRALQEHGVQIDSVGGSGMGAVMAALIALDVSADQLIEYAREAFAANPTGDVSLMPVTSLIKGRQLKAILEEAVEHLAGAHAGIEDTWKSLYCVASNYSKAYEVVLTRGPLARSIRASCATPGLLPPVPIDGDLMVDGGAFNNYPTDVMARAGIARIIGVNIARPLNEAAPFDEIPGAWTLAWDRLTGRRRKYRVPSLMSILMNATMLSSAAREQNAEAMADLEFTLHLPSVGILDWHAFDHVVNVGYRHAHKALEAMSPEELAPYRVRAPRRAAALRTKPELAEALPTA